MATLILGPLFLFVFTSAGAGSSLAATAQKTLPSSPAPVAILADRPLSERVVAYEIDARFDANKHTLDATELLTYRNLTGQPQDMFPFHLYLNAFQPTSTFIREVRRDRPGFEWKDKYKASAEVKSLEVIGMGDLTSQIKFVAPDDGNADDRTVFRVKLPRPVAPNESVRFKIVFHDQFGEVFARTGYRHDFMMGAQWFPKVGVWWQGAWNCHQFHAETEFFADFGTFDVNLTLPQNEVVGASGVQLAEVKNNDGTKTLTFRGEDIHDFAWTAQPTYHVVESDFHGSLGTVKIRLLMQPGHVGQTGRHMRIMQEAMKRFDEWYGPYPYKQITVVDPGDLRAGGMEYPTLITGDTTWWMPEGYRFVEQVVEHEFGHQYWYGMVATNEFEDAWLDEGINSYTECKILDDILGKDTSGMDLWGLTDSDDAQQRNGYLPSADLDPLARFAYQYISGSSYGDITYGKTVTVLFTLEKVIGEETLKRALHTYFMRYRFTHPTKEDFLKTVEEVSGQNLPPQQANSGPAGGPGLRWYFDQAVYGTQVLDYEILRARSDRLDWYEKDRPKEKKGETPYRTMVLVHRKGDFIFPVEVLIKFDNGESVTEHWDGKDRWARYTYEKKAKLVSAEIDPENAVRLDKDFFNNSYTKEADTRASRKLLYYWTWLTQLAAQWLAWLA
jgi:peptidase M1-like protein